MGLEIFTDHERNKIEQGFVFNDDVDIQYLSIDAALEDDRLDIHDFNISLSSTQRPELRNLSSRSDPLGPQGTTISNGAPPLEELIKLEDMEIFKGPEVITYHIRCRELNKKYEQENNVQLDNGVMKEEEAVED